MILRNPQFGLKLLGVRGSRPVSGHEFQIYGGQTTTIELTGFGDTRVFIDAGTGLLNSYQNSKHQSNRWKNLHFVITHTHWDHVIGLNQFPPLFDENASISFHAPTSENGTFESLFERLFSPEHSYFSRDQIKAKLHFNVIKPRIPFQINEKLRVEGIQVNHQAVTLGYKFSVGTKSVCVITDSAPLSYKCILGQGMQEASDLLGYEVFEGLYHSQMIDFINGADLIAYDTHFFDDKVKPDWGHSSPKYAIEICKAGNVKELVMFHHAPEDEDVLIKKKIEEAEALMLDCNFSLVAAREGDEWTLVSA